MISKYSLNDVRVSPFPPLRTMSSDVPLSIDQSQYILSRLGFVHFVGSVQSEAPFLNCTIRGFLYLLRKKYYVSKLWGHIFALTGWKINKNKENTPLNSHTLPVYFLEFFKIQTLCISFFYCTKACIVFYFIVRWCSLPSTHFRWKWFHMGNFNWCLIDDVVDQEACYWSVP